MKRMITFTLALLMIVSLAACGEQPAATINEGTDVAQVSTQATSNDSVLTTLPTDSEPDSTTTTSTSSKPDSTADTQTETGLPDGYKLEVEQTGEKNGIIRLTDPNLQESYPAKDSSLDENMGLYTWRVDLTDSYYLMTLYVNGRAEGVTTVSPTDMNSTIWMTNDGKSKILTDASLAVENKVMTWQFELPADSDFSWDNVSEYSVTIENIPENNRMRKVPVSLADAVYTPDTSTDTLASGTDSDPSDSADSQTGLGGTIYMPTGFPSNPGDAENFNPITDDYIYHSFNSNFELYGLVSYDTSGNIVQFMVKRIYESDDDAEPKDYMDEHTPGDYSPYITKVGNVLYVDYLAMDGSYSQDGMVTRDDGTQYFNRAYFYMMPTCRAAYEADKAKYSDETYYVSKP
jgi:predicted small lipoprotein YifL